MLSRVSYGYLSLTWISRQFNGTYAIYQYTVHAGIVNGGKNRASEVSFNISRAYSLYARLIIVIGCESFWRAPYRREDKFLRRIYGLRSGRNFYSKHTDCL